MKVFVVSGINLIDGGAISVYYDFLDTMIEDKLYVNYKIIALVSKKELFKKYEKYFEIIEFPKSKKNWLYRLYYEYFYFKKFSRDKNIYIWLSLHDITPNVIAEKRYVYCHNPSPFNNMRISEIKYGFKYYLFSKFYKYLYRINIKRNSAVIVQQEWLRTEFKKIFGINNIIVAQPSLPSIEKKIEKNGNVGGITQFIYPSYPRYFKNFEVLCKAAEYLKKNDINNFEVIITLDGTENNYSRMLYKKYSYITNIKFVGILPREELYRKYANASCLVFMSKLETWGMPIIEFKPTNKPIILSDKPYAHETIGEYNNADFVDVDDYEGLAKCMKEVIDNNKLSKTSNKVNYSSPYAKNWSEFLEMIL